MAEQIKHIFCRITVLFTILLTAYVLYLSISGSGYFILASVFVFSGLLLYLSPKASALCEHTADKITFCLFFAIVLIQTVLIFSIYRDCLPWADSLSVINEAVTMSVSDTPAITLSGRYFEMYGNNYFFTILLCYYFKFLRLFGLTAYWIEGLFLNMVSMDLGILFSLYTIRRLKNPQGMCMTAVLCLCNPLLYVFLPFVYTNTISIPFTMGIFCAAILFIQETGPGKRLLYSVLEAVLIGIGFQIRVTTIIPVIALIIWTFLQKHPIRTLRANVKPLAVFAITFLLIFSGCRLLINTHVSEDLRSKNFPVTHWIMMGLQGDGGYYSPDEDFTYNITDKADKSAANIKEIRVRLDSLFRQGPSAILDFAGRKIENTWASQNDGLYLETGRLQKYSPLQPYLFGDKNDILLIYYQIYKILIYGFLLAGLFLEAVRKKTSSAFPFILTLFGFFAFYLLWEANCRYTICLTLLLTLLGSLGASDLSKFLTEKIPSDTAMKTKKILAVFVAAAVMLPGLYTMYRNYPTYTREPIPRTDSSILMVGRSYHEKMITDVLSKGTVMTQTFTSDHSFNEIGIYCSYIGTDDWTDSMKDQNWYQFRLLDSSGAILAQSDFPSEGTGNYFKLFGFDTVTPPGTSEYTIEISRNAFTPADAQDRIGFVYFDFEIWDYIFNAELATDGKDLNRDLIFMVKHNYAGFYTSPTRYLVFCAGIITLLLGFSILLFIEKRQWDKFFSSIFHAKLIQ